MKFLIQSLSIYTHRRFAKLFAFVVIGIAAVVPHIAYAETAGGDSSINSILNSINIYVNVLLRTLSSVFWPVLLMIGSLLDTGLIFGGPMEERLLSAWVEIRNLVNIIFVLILVAVAIYNVLGLGNDGGPVPLGYKAVMPKFVIALILVNFSFVGVKMVLDLSNVITGAVFALPSKTISASPADEMEKAICGKRAKEVPVYNLWCTSNKKFNETAKQYFNQLDRNNISVVYAIRYGKATELKFIREGVKDLGQLGFNIIFNTILFIVYTIGFVALFLVLATRLVVIWLALVMSPLFALTMVLPNLSQFGGSSGDIKEKLIGSIVAPITIGLTMSVGYIMLDAMSSSSAIDPMLSSSSLTAIDANALPTNITTLQQLLVAIGSIVVVWKGVEGAASKTYASGIVSGIMSRTLQVGTAIAKLPLMAPIIPVGAKGTKRSLADVDATLNDLTGRVRGTSFANGAPDKKDVDDARNELISNGMNGFTKVMQKWPQTIRDSGMWKELKTLLVKNATGTDKTEIEKLPDSNPQEADVRRLSTILANSTSPEILRRLQGLPQYNADKGKMAANIFAAIQTQSVSAAPVTAQAIIEMIKTNENGARNMDALSDLTAPQQKENFMTMVRKLETVPELRDSFVQVKDGQIDKVELGDAYKPGNADALINLYNKLLANKGEQNKTFFMGSVQPAINVVRDKNISPRDLEKVILLSGVAGDNLAAVKTAVDSGVAQQATP